MNRCLRKLTLFRLLPTFILLSFFLLPATPSFSGNIISVDTIQGTSFSVYYDYISSKISSNGIELSFVSDPSKNSTIYANPFVIFGNLQGCEFDLGGNLVVKNQGGVSFDVFAISFGKQNITLQGDVPTGATFNVAKNKLKNLVIGHFAWNSPPASIDMTIVFKASIGTSGTGKNTQRILRIIDQTESQSSLSSMNREKLARSNALGLGYQTSANVLADSQDQGMDKLLYYDLSIDTYGVVHVLADQDGSSIPSDIHPVVVTFSGLDGGIQPDTTFYNTLSVLKGQTLSFDVTASAPGSSEALTLKQFYLPEGAQFTPPPKEGPLTGHFQWPVSAAVVNGTYTAIFGAYLGSGTTTFNPTLLVLNINVTDEPPPEIRVDNTNISFSGMIGGQNPAPQTVSIHNAGGGTLTWTANKTQPWLTINPTSGSLPKGNSASTSISVDTTGLSAGTYNDTITISASGASNSPQTVSVTLTLAEQPPALEINPANLTPFSATVGTNPSLQTLTVKNTGGGTLTWSALNSKTWLKLSKTSGNLTSQQSDSITVSVDTGGLAAGTETDQITLSAPGAANAPQVVSATLNLISITPPSIGINASSKAFSATVGGSNPASGTFSVWNSGGGTLNWTATKTQSWLTINPTSGSSTGSGDSKSITVSVNISSLPAGTYMDTITVSSGTASKTVNVTLTLTGGVTAPSIGIYVSSTQFSATVGGSNPAPISVQVFNSGGGMLNWTATKTQSWLTINPTSGSSTGQGNINSGTISVDILGLSAGTYTDTITFSSPGTSISPRTLSFTLTLTGSTTPRIGIDASSMPFSATIGGSNPASGTLSVWNSGVGTLNWTATKGQPWLTINPTSGSSTGPGNSTPIIVSVDITGLSATTYTDTITISSPDASNSPQTVSVTLTLISNEPLLELSPANTLNFYFPLGSQTPLILPFYVKNTGMGTLNWSLSYTQPSWVTSVSVPTGGGGQIIGPGQTAVNITVFTAQPVTDSFIITVNGGAAGTKTITVNLIPSSPSGAVLAWNTLTDFIDVAMGQIINYTLTNTGSNYTNMSITVYALDLSTNVTCVLTFPDGRYWEQTLSYQMSSNAFNFRSQYASYPNIPDVYLPQGPYTLRITGNNNGYIRIKTLLQ